MEAAHRIGRLRFEVGAPDQSAFDTLRAMLRLRLEGLVLPRLQTAIDGAGRGGELVRYGRIEVDLGAVSADESAEQLANRMGDGLAASLGQAQTRMEAGTGFEGAGGSDGREAAGQQQDLAAMLEAFLRTGTLPWPQPGPALGALTQALAELEEPALTSVAERLRPALANVQAAERLVRQLPAALVYRIVAALRHAVEAKPPTDLYAAHPRAHVAEPAVAALAAQVAAAASRAPARLQADQPDPPPGTEPLLREPGADVRSPRQGARRSQPWAGLKTEPGPPDQGAGTEAGPAPAPERRRTAAATPAPVGRAAPDAPTQRPADGRPPEERESASWPVAAAGLVLLHPFLPAFFKRTGLIGENHEFVGAAARRRAVLLAHFLAANAEEVAEPDLVLAKLLCGLDFAEPVPCRLDPTALEQESADALLAAAIGHWEALGGASPAALRETFLERSGRLERAAEGWRLLVEKRGVDVLLDRLPWSISIVKTPFMAALLRVDWR